MNNEHPKPFACTSVGCGMSFTNEDHLTVHVKKHDLVLNLNASNKANIFADQTPTPTRLLKNCEEVGLFEDLQNVNPFDETFRLAVQSKETTPIQLHTTLTDPLAFECEETLHTPHVFPTMPMGSQHHNLHHDHRKKPTFNKTISHKSKDHDDEMLIDLTVESKSSATETTNKNVVVVDPITATVPVILMKETAIKKEKPSLQRPILPKIVPIIDTTPTSVIMKPVKQELKEMLLKERRFKATMDATIKPEATSINQNHKRKAQPSSTSSSTWTVPPQPPEYPGKNERNRAAVGRYRMKLKQNNKAMQRRNEQLEADNARLKKELAQVKTLLLAHRDCPVTKAMQLGVNIPVGPPKLVPAAANVSVVTDKTQPAGGQQHLFTKGSGNGIVYIQLFEQKLAKQ